MMGTSTRRHLRLAGTAIVFATVLAGCTATAQRPPAQRSPASQPPSTQSYSPQVVHFGGVQGIRFGDLRASLSGGGQFTTVAGACEPKFTTAPELGPVFDGEQLVLTWVNPPFRTPEGLTVGSPVADVRRAHPAAEQLTPPAGSYVFPGLLVTQTDRAYLFLHDGQTVQKMIVGYTEHARELYHQGFGQCRAGRPLH